MIILTKYFPTRDLPLAFAKAMTIVVLASMTHKIGFKIKLKKFRNLLLFFFSSSSFL